MQVAVARRAGAGARRPRRASLALRRGRGRRKKGEVAATRSFLVDVHLLKARSPPRRAGPQTRRPLRLPSAGRDGVMRAVAGCSRGSARRRAGRWCARGSPRSGRLRPRRRHGTRRPTGVERMRFALGADHDLRPFHGRFSGDPLIGPGDTRAGRGCARHGGPSRWRRSPGRSASSSSSAAAPRRSSAGSSTARAAQRRAARCGRRPRRLDRGEVAGRARELRPQPEARDRDDARRPRGRLRPRRPPATTSAPGPACARSRHRPVDDRDAGLEGQGRDDQLPARDLAYVKLVGLTAGPRARARPRKRCASSSSPTASTPALAGSYALHGGEGSRLRNDRKA